MYIFFSYQRRKLRTLYLTDNIDELLLYTKSLRKKLFCYPPEFHAEILLLKSLIMARWQEESEQPWSTAPAHVQTEVYDLARDAKKVFAGLHKKNNWCIHARMLLELSHELVRWLQYGLGKRVDLPLNDGVVSKPELVGRDQEIWFELIDELGKCDCERSGGRACGCEICVE